MSSNNYWRKREEEALKQYIKEEAEYDKEINRIYSDMLDSCNKEINAFYGKYAKAEGITLAEAKKRVSKLDIAEYERKAARYVKDASLDRKANGGKTNKKGYYFSEKANEEMRLYNLTMKVNRLEMLKANIGLEMIKGHAELESFMGDILKGRTEAELARQAGILGKTVRNNAQLAHAIPNASFHNATFSDRVWMYHDVMKADLEKLLKTGLIQGKNPRQLARELEKYVKGDAKGGAKFNAERLMRTELARVQTEAQKQSFERNGFEEYEFIANSNCCDICKANDGKHFKVSKMMPGENAAPMHPHCRCSAAAYSDRKEYDEWLNFLEQGGTTEEYNKLSKAERQKITQSLTKSSKNDNMQLVKSFDELEAYLNDKHGISIDGSVKQLDFESVKSGLVGVEEMINKVPGLSNIIKKVKTDKGGTMSYLDDTVYFNPARFDESGKVQKLCDEYSQKGWWVKNNTVSGMGVHEATHAVEWLLIQKNEAYEFEWQKNEAWNKCTEAKSIVSQACKNIKKTEYGKGKKNAELISSISRYANDTASEAMAEAFSDVYDNGKNANLLSLEIERLTMEKLLSYEGAEQNEN